MLRVFNSLTKEKEDFVPIDKGVAGIYTCGPTVYDYAHVGNLRSYIFSDILKRILLYNGFKVKHVMNITDVGHLTNNDQGADKLERAAKRQSKDIWELAKFYTDAFIHDMKDLNILSPDIWCKATDHVKEQIEMVKKLEKKGVTYKTSQGIYFDTSKIDDYGKMMNMNMPGLEEGKRIPFKERKNPSDFALWKFSPKDEERQMEWESPWNKKSFPGWHIECSAMASKYLGEQFDLHTGGIDHINVHHSNEIAQSETCFGKKPWVKYWMHGEFLVLGEGMKMGKTHGNFIRLETLKEKSFDAMDYRYFTFTAHYRKQLTFTWEALENAKNSLGHLKEKVRLLLEDNKSKKVENDYEERFLEAINDDLNMPEALAVMWDMLKDENLGNKEKYNMLMKFDKVFGLRLDKVKDVDVSKEIKDLIKKREDVRKKKDFKKADEIREEIEKKGYRIEDVGGKIRIRKK
jgi:cysteinyl-tRNA synthetase